MVDLQTPKGKVGSSNLPWDTIYIRHLAHIDGLVYQLGYRRASFGVALLLGSGLEYILAQVLTV